MTPADAARAARRLRGCPRNARDAFWLALAAGGVMGLVIVPLLHRAGVVADAELGGRTHDGYVELARSLARGDGFVFEPGGDPVSHRPPLYPLLLVPIALLPDALQRPALTGMQVLLLGATAASAYQIAGRWFGAGSARLAVRLLLLNPWLLWMTAVAMCPLLQLTLYTWLLRALFASGPGPRVSSTSPWAGVAAGALALTHGAMPVTIALLFGAAGLLALRRGGASLAPLAAAAALALACIAPWTVRNWMVFQRLIPVASNAGLAYFAGTAHWGQGPLTGKVPPHWVMGSTAGDEGMRIAGILGRYDDLAHFYGLRDVAVSERLDALAREHARADLPRLASKLVLNGLEYYWPIVFYALRAPDESVLARVLAARGPLLRSFFYLGLWVLALAAFLRPRRDRRLELALVAFGLLAFWLPYLPFLTFAQHSMYNLGTLPCLSLLAALGWEALTGIAPARPA
jgi:4-amino-4-deoxy-L-arabinose transferase-like glycosyltransferase